MNETSMIAKNSIKNKIHTIRGLQVMLDRDLAELYEVETKRLNEQVKRNIERFPKDFMFQLTETEKNELVAKCDHLESLKYASNTPYAFTEHGVTALSGILKSKKANHINIQVIRAFVAMRRFIYKNAEIFLRLDNVEQKHIEYDDKFKKVFDAIENKDIVKSQGIFFNGQIFDAHRFISDLIRTAERSIILIDNYVDDSVLTLFSKKNKDVRVTIFTKHISKQLKLDLEKYNSQYDPITIKEFKEVYDRFMIIDNKEVYHIGASLKDLGKKWFAFSRFEKDALELLAKLR
ncbi:ORF6N domain-containing protein [Candidatus Woesearchaeota archaeon]|nr:ORF6N domain-containing protein [Candidatus Woesearchaeota archaeon]